MWDKVCEGFDILCYYVHMGCKTFGIRSMFPLHNVLLTQQWYSALFTFFSMQYFKHCVFRAHNLISLLQSRISKAYLHRIRLAQKKKIKNKVHAVGLTMWLKDFMQVSWIHNICILSMPLVLHTFLLILFIGKFSATCK